MSDKSFEKCTCFKSTCNIYEYLWMPCTPANDEVEAHLNTQSEVVNIVSQEIPSPIPEGGSVELSHKAPESGMDGAEFYVTVVPEPLQSFGE